MAEMSQIGAKEVTDPGLEEQIANLKRKKTAAKTALTKCRNKLLTLLEQELPERKMVRALINEVSSLQNKAVDVLVTLQLLYHKCENTELAMKTKQEIELLEVVSEEAVEKADLLLRNTFGSTTSKSMFSGVGNLFKESGVKYQTQEIPKPIPTNIPVKPGSVGEPGKKSEVGSPSAILNPTCMGHRDPIGIDLGQDLWKQLKRVAIPVFSGDVHTYESWKAAFLACVDRAPATNEYKLLQLRQYLVGEAAKVVEKLGHNASAYDIALDRLERKYGGRRRQIALKLEEVSNFRPLRPGNAKDLDQFADMLDTVVVCLRESDKVEELGDGCLYVLLLKKLTESMITQYKRWIFEQQRQESVETLREWLLLEADLRTIAFETKHGFSEKSKPSSDGKLSKSYFGTHSQDKVQTCPICNLSNHKIWQCEMFKAMTVEQRWYKAKKLKLCFRCFSTDHLGKSCSQMDQCGIGGCQATHNRLLHYTNPSNKAGHNSNVDKATSKVERSTKSSDKGEHINSVTQMTTMSTLKQRSDYIALRTVPVVLKNGNRRLKVNALLDDASTQTYINESVAYELGLSGQTKQVSVSVLNSKTESFNSMSVKVGLESLDGSVDTTVVALTTAKVTGKLKAIDWKNHGKSWSHLKDIQFPRVASRPIIDILIGVDYLELHTSRGDVCGNPGEPIARLTPLGWTCIGNIAGNSSSEGSNTFFVRNIGVGNIENADLDQAVQKFWEMESFPSLQPTMANEDKLANDAVKNSVTYSNGRYKVGIPWKQDPVHLPKNYAMALSRLENVERKLVKDQSLLQAYSNVIDKYLEKGYIRKVPEAELQNSRWFLPHFPVVKLDRDTTKVRIVFDGSAKCRGRSLNDFIHPGPKLQNELFDILLRFRRYPVGIICDIAEMYLQIEVSEKDRPCLRFLWRSVDQEIEPTVYEFSRVVFGLNCSPFLAQFISQEHARRNETLYPLAAEVVSESTYMDDSMDSIANEAMAIELYGQLKTLWSSAGMHARKWISNSVAVLNEIPVKDRLKEVQIHVNDLPLTKALGLLWSAECDQFQFLYSVQETPFIMTKRNFLKVVARVFDPLGLIAPFLIRAKILLQLMWIAGVGWDDRVGSGLENRAWQWIREIDLVQSLKVPRCIQFIPNSNACKLHVFVDASQEAYGAVVYAVTQREDHLTSTLVASKAHVSPLKTVSIPRMELLAAVLGVKLLEFVLRSLNVTTSSTILWSDSINVLWWVKSQSRSFKSFVANRIGYIQDHTNPSQWMYVPTQHNPADLLTRGVRIESLTSRFWLQGPDFLNSDSAVPEQIVDFESCRNLERKKSSLNAVSMVTELHLQSPWRLDPTRFSNLSRLCRVTAWVLRFLHNIRVPSALHKMGALDIEEIEDAETRLFVDVQKKTFSKEYTALSNGNKIPSNSKILGLQPVLDRNGLLRLGGRLKQADTLSFEAKHPIILPRKNWVTKLVVKSYHENTLHMGTNSTLAALSGRFWIVAAREEIRDWERECTFCRRQKTKPVSQIMAELPAVRVRCSMRAFSQVGIDFAGPFHTMQGRGKARKKRYLCLFTCLSTRAVHLEMAFGLDTNAFLNAFFRMAHRRGMPKEVITDNGTNFVGAAKELKQLVGSLDSDQIRDSSSSKGISWKFNPPHAPHFGGVFESLIKSAKRAIYAILKDADINDEELMTAFTATEALLNSRPLTYQSSHPDDDVPLTPNHFIHGQMGGEFAPELDSSSFHPQKRWRRVQDLVKHIWKRWMKEWIPTLNCRKKWFVPVRDFEIGDIVIVVSADTSRGQWPRGRITNTFPGRDGHVRVVEVQVGKSKLTRPVTKICPLEWSAESQKV